MEWVVVYENTDRILSENVKNELESNGVYAVVINKVDSNYPVFGMSYVKVPANQKEEAEELIKNL